MHTLSGIKVVGIGAGSLDYIPSLPEGQAVPLTPYDETLDFVKGGKSDLVDADCWRFDALRACAGVEREVGGNMVNALAYIAVYGGADNVSAALALGADDHASLAIEDRLVQLGIDNRAKIGWGYCPSESIIYRRRDENGHILDRMVLGRPRMPMRPLVDEGYVEDRIHGKNVVVAASLKDQVVNDWVSRHAAGSGAFISWNFGSSELRNYPQALRSMLQVQPPSMVSLNLQEAQQLTGCDSDVIQIQMDLLFGLGLTRGAVITDAHRIIGVGRLTPLTNKPEMHFQRVLSVPPEQIVDTLGAGDAVHGAAVVGMVQGLPLRHIAEQSMQAGAEAIKHVGAHRYLLAS